MPPGTGFREPGDIGLESLARQTLMSTRQPRYSKEESARRGQEIYERQIRPQVEEGNRGKVVAIDIESGAFEVAGDTLAASDRLLARYPDAQIWFVRIGHRSLHRFGQRLVAKPA